MAIKSIEWLGFFEAEKISVKSEWMRDEVIRIYKVPEEKIVVISTDSWLLDILKLYKSVIGLKSNERRLNRNDADLGVSTQGNRRISPHVYFLSKTW